MRKLRLSTKFRYQEISWNYKILGSVKIISSCSIKEMIILSRKEVDILK